MESKPPHPARLRVAALPWAKFRALTLTLRNGNLAANSDSSLCQGRPLRKPTSCLRDLHAGASRRSARPLSQGRVLRKSTSRLCGLNAGVSRRSERSLSHWERVGVRGYGLSIGHTPSPWSLSPWERGPDATEAIFRRAFRGERVGARDCGLSIGHPPSPCSSPEGERLSFAVKARHGRGDRRRRKAGFASPSPEEMRRFSRKAALLKLPSPIFPTKMIVQ
jgi:hypothetical protein